MTRPPGVQQGGSPKVTRGHGGRIDGAVQEEFPRRREQPDGADKSVMNDPLGFAAAPDGDGHLADPQVPRTSERSGGKTVRIHPDEPETAGIVNLVDPAGQAPPIGQRDTNPAAAHDDIAGGQNESVRRDDDPRPRAFSPQNARRRVSFGDLHVQRDDGGRDLPSSLNHGGKGIGETFLGDGGTGGQNNGPKGRRKGRGTK